jgi:thioredoxin 1
MASLVRTITDDDFEGVLNANRATLIEFGAEWCGPCKAMLPALEDVAREYEGEIVICKMDIEKSPETAKKFGVRGVPMFVLFRDSEAVGSTTGSMPRTQLALFVESALVART